ncbi:YbbR-like domain-containing protein [Pelovirga terrestris]|uniref:YbbR-like domain-containing protein n=1 Tax=Pelovirga terrestris TaxID=2771352 RepID=A0A8J6UGH8_9BACT|nr:CdaR family protein [Pelovirga terrestris]MBD1399778.1 YbbR-like domain-containing protein [Pelovirga terrestris]
MFKLITENWTLKLLSLVFALMLWFFIMGERRLEVNYRVPLELQNLPRELMVANEIPSMVDVRISGPRTLLMKVSPNDISITVDLTGLNPGLTSFRRLEERLNLPSGLRVTRLSPSFVDVRLERVQQKTVPINILLTGDPMGGFGVGTVRAIPDQVAIEGAESELKNVTNVTTNEVDLSGVNSSFSLIVPLQHQGRFSWFKDESTTEIQVEIIAVESAAEDGQGPIE